MAPSIGAYDVTVGPSIVVKPHEVPPNGVPSAPRTSEVSWTVYVVDGASYHIYKLAPDGTLLATFGSRGSAPGQFDRPTAIALDPIGNVGVLRFNHTLPPFDHDGKQAVRAFVFRCEGGKPFVAYLLRYKEGSQNQIELLKK